MGAVKVLTAISIITITSVFILPWALKLSFGDDLHPLLGLGLALALGLPMVGFIGWELHKTVSSNRRAREARRKDEAIAEQMYGCIKPQILNSFVVFPVRVGMRHCSASSWVEMGQDAMVVNLCSAVKVTGGQDTEGPVRRLCEATFGEDFQVVVFCGGGKAGPTGLSVGVGRPDFGPHLARMVAQRIDQAIRLGLVGR